MSAIRTINNVEYPVAGTWTAVPGHSELDFIVRHMGLSKVRGRFSRINVVAGITEDLVSSTLDVTIDMASIQTGEPDRDKHLQSNDFFDVQEYPVARFRSQGIDLSGRKATAEGELTIREVTRPVTLNIEYLGHGVAPDLHSSVRTFFTASATINREDWALTWNRLLETGGLLISKEVRLEVEVELELELGRPINDWSL